MSFRAWLARQRAGAEDSRMARSQRVPTPADGSRIGEENGSIPRCPPIRQAAPKKSTGTRRQPWYLPNGENSQEFSPRSFSATTTGLRHTMRAEMENPMLASEQNSLERSRTHDIRNRTIRNSRRSRSAPEDHAPSGARNDPPWAYPGSPIGNRRVSEGVALQNQRSRSRHSFGCSQARFTRSKRQLGSPFQ